MNNADKKPTHFTDYSNLSAQMPVPTPYGVIPETLNDYRTAAYYAAAYPYGLMYDNRMVYMQAPQGYSIPVTQDNQSKNKRVPTMPTQYVDPKSVSNDDMTMGAFQYAAHYPNPQPSLSGYPAMVSASQYPMNPVMLQQGMMLSYPPQPAPVKRDASTQSLYILNDKSAKKPAVQQRMQRVPQVPYSMVPQPVLSTPVVSMQSKAAPPDTGRMPPKYIPPSSRFPTAPKPEAPALEKTGITDMERTVAGILCRMKSTAPMAGVGVNNGVVNGIANGVSGVANGIVNGMNATMNTNMNTNMNTMPVANPMNSPPTTNTIPTIPPLATSNPPPTTPAVPAEPTEKPETVPPIPSPPQSLLAPSNALPIVEPRETGEKEQTEAASIIPSLDPDKLIYGRTPAQQRGGMGLAAEATGAKSEAASAKLEAVVTIADEGDSENAATTKSDTTTTDASKDSPQDAPQAMKPTQTEEGDTPEVPLVAMKTEEETVPLVAIASDKKQEDSDVVPLVHISSTEEVSREGSQRMEPVPLVKPPQ